MTLKEYQRMTGAKHKYRNNPVYDEEGIRHDSKKEYARWRELLLLQKVGEISHLERQKKFVLRPGFQALTGEKVRAMSYIADFYYYDETEDRRHCQNMKTRWVIEDVKSPATKKDRIYRLKRNEMLYRMSIGEIKGYTIKET